MMVSNKAPLLPPRGIFVSTRLLFDTEIVPHLKSTLLQLMALAWRSGNHTTPKLTYGVLEKVLAKDERTLRGHLTQLRSYHAALRLRYAEPGQFYVVLADWLYQNDGPRESPADQTANGIADCSRIPLPDKELKNQNQEEEELFNPELPPPPPNDHVLDHHDHDQSPELTHELDGELVDLPEADNLPEVDDLDSLDWVDAPDTAPGAEEVEEEVLELPEDLREALLARGLFPQLLSEVAERAWQSGYTSDDLRALLNWSTGEDAKQPAALFMYRLRKEARPPEQYLAPACPRCGERGRHAAGCPRGYSADF